MLRAAFGQQIRWMTCLYLRWPVSSGYSTHPLWSFLASASWRLACNCVGSENKEAVQVSLIEKTLTVSRNEGVLNELK
ncbi:hypothetical protein V8C42DRAFT_308241 [Trichoderma barbatum]